MAERFERTIKSLGISLARGTDGVPDDGRYHVLRDGAVEYSAASRHIAEAYFELLREQVVEAHPELVDPRTVLARESSFRDILGVRGAGRERARSRQDTKGGKGGRSGV